MPSCAMAIHDEIHDDWEKPIDTSPFFSVNSLVENEWITFLY